MKTDYQPKSKWSIDDIDTPNVQQYQQNKPRKIGRWILISLIVIILSITWLANTSTHSTTSNLHKQTKEQHSNMVSIPLSLPKRTHTAP